MVILQVIGVVPYVLRLDASTVKYLFLYHFVQQQVYCNNVFYRESIATHNNFNLLSKVDKFIFLFFSHFAVLHFRGDVAKVHRLIIAVSKTAELTQLTGTKVQVIGKCSTNIGRPQNILQFCPFFLLQPTLKLLFCYSPHLNCFS